MIKTSFSLICFLLVSPYLFAQPRLTEQWRTEHLDVPESVLITKGSGILYTSLIGPGDHTSIDGNGSIALLNKQGKILDKQWISGLNAPKGIGIYKDTLYVADLKELVIIDVPNKKILKKISVPAVGMLNDVTIDHKGNVYVSDSKGGKIYSYINGNLTVFLGDLINPNGLLAEKNGLYFLDSGSLFLLDNKKKVSKIAEDMDKSTDGLQKDGDNFIVSAWGGVLYYVTKDGKVTTLLDSKAEKMNTADFAFDSESRLLYLPTFFKNQIIAYKLQ
ncbi:SMP-30/gluconolactonase/LRE family protein [Olivibacter sp. XZL3]|uniref:SMP-30/gluconolactonase/LRE family protein n=1 Tax=Olivibacter sp. XZL3 TaxID=1735116 RepID=UPI0010648FA1|nr:ATP/GTP-binding protein [Olivibacter sp. XZL3]